MQKPCRYFGSKIFFNLSYEGKEQERILVFLLILTQSAWPHEQDQSLKFRGLVFMSRLAIAFIETEQYQSFNFIKNIINSLLFFR